LVGLSGLDCGHLGSREDFGRRESCLPFRMEKLRRKTPKAKVVITNLNGIKLVSLRVVGRGMVLHPPAPPPH